MALSVRKTVFCPATSDSFRGRKSRARSPMSIPVVVAVMVTVAVAMRVPVIMLVFIVIVVAGQCETAEHQGHRDCQGCHPHASHNSSHPAPSFAGLIAITLALETIPGTGLLKRRMLTQIKSAVLRSIFF